ncbi:hypothetical protein T439DRAFT_239992 [Meredithblackwellia eburnea MCA 4105]
MTVFELSPLYRHSNSVTLSTTNNTSVSAIVNQRFVQRDIHDLRITSTQLLPVTNTVSNENNKEKDKESIQIQSSINGNLVLAIPTPILKSKHAFIINTSPATRHTNGAGTEDDPYAKLEIGQEGAVAMAWSKSTSVNDAVLVWSASHLKISIFRLSAPTSPALYIHNPKLNPPVGFSFRPKDGRYLAVVERHQGRDHVGIYDAQVWKLVRHFPLPSTSSDVADLSWSPCGRYIAIWESAVDYILHIYTPDGRLLSTFTPYTPSSPSPSSTPTTEEDQARIDRSQSSWVGLGIRCVEWHPTGDWIAIGGWDGKIRVLSRVGWVAVAELSCPAKVGGGVNIWKEPEGWIEKTRGKGIVTFDTPTTTTTSLNPLRPDLGRPNPRMGISKLAWSSEGKWLACCNQSHPTALWVFSFLSPSHSSPSPSSSAQRPALHFRPRLQSLIIHYSAPGTLGTSNEKAQGIVREFGWRPTRGQEEEAEMLVATTGQGGFTVWRETPGVEGCTAEGVGIPSRTTFAPVALSFSPDGSAILLNDREMFAVAYPVEDEDIERERDGERSWYEDDD